MCDWDVVEMIGGDCGGCVRDVGVEDGEVCIIGDGWVGV